MESVVVSLGGSVLIPGDEDSRYLSSLADLIHEASKEYHLYLVCGGGKVARYYITEGRALGASERQLDEMGIMVTRINARLLQLALGGAAAQGMPTSAKEAAELGRKGGIVVMGGTEPGHTTDAVAAMVAAEIGADRIINATSVPAAYTKDPRKHADAVRLQKMTHAELHTLVNKGLHGAGPSDVFDKKGAEIAMGASIPILIVAGRDLEDLGRAVRGEPFQGTYVGP
ncbi:MAG: UMP kinase [Methanomassiliicoccales archaeon]